MSSRRWKTEDGLYDEDEVLYLGEIAVGAVRRNSAVQGYEYDFYLDDQKQLWAGDNVGETLAKRRVEQLLDVWLHKAGLEER